ncbi:FecR family protein [Hyphococcus luteus]|uniref:FecR protein domain-containing protein n=1 Tax=Hyphococcus luteus TaxID=2058213 RepID=A0A2S7K0I6_9PROT|nr:FecR family protein [Marinicaulis flavus]PQA86012.1 hypothetical protein CW354_16665 [Marinicaulis flavus]
MKLTKYIASLVGSLFMLIAAAYADNGGWRVVETSGAVRISQTMAGVQLVSTGETLRGGSILSTGLDGRAVLARGEQTIVVGPNSRMSLPAIEEKGMTRIFQDLGTLMFKVDKREKQHFRVETPVIAAVVKGTTFTVTAGTNSHAVHVAEGLVEVTPIDSNNSVLVPAGETVRVSTADHAFMQPARGGGDNAKPEPTEIEPAEGGKRAGLMIPTNIGVDPIDFAGVTDGLVKAENPGAMARESNSPVFDAGNFRQASNANPRALAAITGDRPRGPGANTGVNANAGAGNGLAIGLGNSNGNAGGNGNGIALGVGNGNGNAGGNGNGIALGVGNGNGNGNGNGLALGVGNGNGNTGGNSNTGGGANVNVNAGGGANVGVNAGGGNGGADVDVNAGAGGVDVGVNAGGGNGGVDVNVTAGAGGAADVNVTAGAGAGGVNVGANVGGLGVGLGGDGLDLDANPGQGQDPGNDRGLLPF